MSDREPMTKEGEVALQEELQKLLTERPKISKAIAEAREFGDLKENAEYLSLIHISEPTRPY